MQALLWDGPRSIVVTEVDDPAREGGDVVVDVEAAGICASELEAFQHGYPARRPPLVMDHEFAGRRADTGERVAVNPVITCGSCDRCIGGEENVCLNRRIIGIHRPGGFAERVVVPESSCYVLKGDSAEQGAMVEPLANAVHAVALADLSSGERVGVGAGVVGALVAWVLARDGVHVVVAEPASSRRAQVAEIPADVRAALDVSDLDVTFDAAGTAGARRDAVGALRPGGTSVWLGLAAADPGFDAQSLVRSERRVVGSSCYRVEDFQEAVQLAALLPESWARLMPLSEGATAFRALLDDRSGPTRTVLVPERPEPSK